MRDFPNNIRLLLSFLLAFSLCANVQSQHADSLTIGIFDLIGKDENGIDLTLKTDMKQIMNNKRTNDFVEGEFTFERSKKNWMTVPVRIRCRGKYRRMKCNFPPLKLKFRKDDLSVHGLNDFNELKLVTHCMDERAISDVLILKEYLVYKLYNEITEHSFRVKLVNVTYLDSEKKSNKLKGMGILIEDSEELAHRASAKITERMGLPFDSLHAEQEKIASLFQCMISNMDWSYQLNRNVELLIRPDGYHIPVPYDFDFSAVVSAPYASLDPKYGQKSLQDRVFIGVERPMEEMQNTIAYYLGKEKKLLDMVDDFKELDGATRKEIREYLATFFDILENETEAIKLLSEKK